ncbi:MAG: polysaccharide deacetylase family protein [Alphaproteobacteria bacterium]
MTDDLLPWQWPESTWRPIVEKVRAGRSLAPKSWPNGAKCAVALSFDSDHETTTLRWGDSSPGTLSANQYGARKGIPRILNLLKRHDIPASFYVPAVTALIHPDEQRRIIGEGHEIGIHSWIHEMNSTLPPKDERDIQMRAADTLEQVCGVRPVGIRTPSWDFSPVTLAITREMELLYDSSLMADDEPYELVEDGEPTGIVEIPVEWIRDDMPYFGFDFRRNSRPHMPPSGLLEILASEFDVARVEGGLFQLTMHPHIIGHRSRMAMLDQFVEHIKAAGDVWFATHADIARWCLKNAP